MKYILILFFIVTQLYGFTVSDDNKLFEIDEAELKSFEKFTIETHREEKKKDDLWEGTLLSDILKKYGISDFSKLKFISADNYLVRISKQEIENNKPIIAYIRNGKQISKYRLVIPELRDMFWIQGIAEIVIEKNTTMFAPNTAFIAENLLSKKEFKIKLPPFEKMQGYTFLDLVTDVFPLQQEEVILYGTDAVMHRLDFEKYLMNAVLVENKGSYDLKSPNMPAGMWIKNIAVIQQVDRIIIFKSQFKNFSEVFELIKLENIPNKLNIKEDVSIKTDFTDDSWDKIRKITW